MPHTLGMLYSPRLDALMYESNYRTDIGTLADVCGMFSLACFTVLVTGGLHYVVLLLLRWTSILVGHHEEKSFPVPPPYVVSDVSPHEESLSTIEHSLTHLAVIMDGNRRYGGKGRIAEPSNVTSRHEAIREICREVCYDGVKESIAASPSASRPPSERAWVTPRYEYFLSLIRATALDGHRKGGEKLIDFIKDCITARIPILTVYAFSTENWRRPPYEVDTLMTLFFFFFERIRHTAKEHGIYVRFVCTDVVRLPPRVLERMQAVERESRHFTPRRIVVNVCVSYGGQEEVACACSRVLQRRLRSGDCTSDVSAAELGAEMLRCLTQSDDEEGERRIFASTAAREPQLILRTSGEQRLSNFLLYQSAYSEFVFSKKRWPEMEAGDLLAAIRQFSSRDRRNGK